MVRFVARLWIRLEEIRPVAMRKVKVSACATDPMPPSAGTDSAAASTRRYSGIALCPPTERCP